MGISKSKIKVLEPSIIISNYCTIIFFLLALQPPMGVVFYSPLAGFSLLACEDS